MIPEVTCAVFSSSCLLLIKVMLMVLSWSWFLATKPVSELANYEYSLKGTELLLDISLGFWFF